jgi:hypothetical protein
VEVSLAVFDGWSASPIGPCLISGLLGVMMLTSQMSPRRILIINLIIAGLILVINQQAGGKAASLFRGKGSLFKAGLLLIGINMVVTLWQRAATEGLMVPAILCINESLFLGSLILVSTGSQENWLFNLLKAFTGMLIYFSVANLMAERVGFGFDYLTDRTAVFESRLGDKSFRWQTPLYSAWQMSGLLRVSLPLSIMFAVQRRHRRLEAAFWLVGAVIMAFVMKRIEYRAAVIPTLFLGGLLLLRNQAWRCTLGFGAVIYAFAAPLILPSESVQKVLLDLLPDSLETSLGQRLQEIVTFSGRTEIWKHAIRNLMDGSHFFLGEGQYNLDCSKDLGAEMVVVSDLFRRISFHQGAIDIFYIYGTFFAGILCGCLLWGVWRGFGNLCSLRLQPFTEHQEMLALLTIALVAIANAHDGFFVEHNIFYLVVAACLAVLQRSRSADS